MADEEITEHEFDLPEGTAENVHQVDEHTWEGWNMQGRRTFNAVFGIATKNRALITATDLFPIAESEKENLNKILTATIFNLSFEAAGYVTDLTEENPN